ncbi:TIGR04222 domain-containing membrane protein [Fischerella sp. PCC 9605]|uniref:TIGR04222 domain-containing membrane protein n=1 Tax=Fischerella sp. PCC 9605 TaxID=1173024 RepID=UPI0004BB6E5B|nr:TIGR04222 domain-containing membrane protein [Fischerella sp. PCC 9605]
MNQKQCLSFFGQASPVDIYPNADICFVDEVDFTWVHNQQNWYKCKFFLKHLPHVCLNQPMLFFQLFFFAVAVRVSPLFLIFYIFLAIVAMMIALIVHTYLRKTKDDLNPDFPSLNVYETAYLAGGLQRTADTAITSLVQHGYLQPQPETRSLNVKTPLPEDSDPLEKEIWQAVKLNGNVNQIRISVARATFPLYHRLVNLGLVLSLDQVRNLRLWFTLPVLALLVLGIGMIIMGVCQHQSVELLVLLCMITAIIGCSFLFVPIHRSLYGDRVLENLRTTHINLKQTLTVNSTATNSQLLMTFALFGVKVLTNSSFSDLQQVLVSPPSSNRTQQLWRWLSRAISICTYKDCART